MKVLITGATGLVGKELVRVFHKNNIDVNYLTTNKSKIKSEENYTGFYWNTKTNEIDENCIKDVNCIIHLAGASVSKRWTKSYKKEIIDSRINGSKLLFSTIKSTNNKTVKHFISSSGISIYKNSYTTLYDENSTEFDNSFLSDVVKKWEASADEFESKIIKVAKIRTGIVLAKKGGALEKMLFPIKIGFGSAFGNGKHWQSWIHINDLANLFFHVYQSNLYGTFNAVAPNPVTNKELIKSIAKKLKKPLFMPNVPAFALKLMLGEMYRIVIDSQKVSCTKIINSGFKFKFNTIDDCLNDVL